MNFIGPFAKKLRNVMKLPIIVNIFGCEGTVKSRGHRDAKKTVIESLEHVLLAVAFQYMASGVYRVTEGDMDLFPRGIKRWTGYSAI